MRSASCRWTCRRSCCERCRRKRCGRWGRRRRCRSRRRVLAATNRDLATMVEQGRFRKDLYFRLNVVNLRIPPLRDRRADIPALAMHFLEKMERETGVATEFLGRCAAGDAWSTTGRGMCGSWRTRSSGRARCRAGRCCIWAICRRSCRTFGCIGRRRVRRSQEVDEAALDGVLTRDADGSGRCGIVSIAEMEKHAILGTIRQLKGDKLMAAKLLGIGKTTLYRKLKEYGITDVGEGLD